MKALAKKAPDSGKTDLLLRFFEYLYQNPQPGVEDYLCNKLYELPESAVERYLLQFVYLAVSRPGSALENTIQDLCSKSFVIALKVHWLLLALVQDNPKNKHVEQLKDKCEKAALEGKWDLPFRDTKLDPLSPQCSALSQDDSPLLSPTIQPPGNMSMVFSPPNYDHKYMGAHLNIIEEGAEAPTQPSRKGSGLQIDLGCLLTPEQRGLSLDNAAVAPPPLLPPLAMPSLSMPQLNEHVSKIRKELGDGEGVTALLTKSAGNGVVSVTEDDGIFSDDEHTPMSPTTRLRRDTHGATLDFMEVLCDASSTLTSISQEERQRALRMSLEAINKELDSATRRNVAVWFPMGRPKDRILRIAAKEAVLLNSREKAPFMLFVEVLEGGGDSSSTPEQPAASDTPHVNGTETVSKAGPNHHPSSLASSSSPTPTTVQSDSTASASSSMTPSSTSTCKAELGAPLPELAATSKSSVGDPAKSSSGEHATTSAAAIDASEAALRPGHAGPIIFPQRRRTASIGEPALFQPIAAAAMGGSFTAGTGDSFTSGMGGSFTAGTGASFTAGSSIASESVPPIAVASDLAADTEPCSSDKSLSSVVATAAAAAAASQAPPGGASPTSTIAGSQGVVDASTLCTPGNYSAGLLAGAAASTPQPITSRGAYAHTPVSTSTPGMVLFSDADTSATPGSAALPPLPPGVHRQLQPPHRQRPLSEQEVQELIHAGCLSPSASGEQSTMMDRMAHAMASLRGEAPLIRLHLRVLDTSGISATGNTGGNGSAGGSAGSGSASQHDAAGLSPSSALHAFLLKKSNTSGMVSSDRDRDTDSSSSSLLSGGPAKALSLLSKFGLCRRPVLDEDEEAEEAGRPRRSQRLVAVSLEVAGGVNLAITSPYRKSRRTPSHEAISMVASKFKIHEIPPPAESGPPRGPVEVLDVVDLSSPSFSHLTRPKGLQEQGQAGGLSMSHGAGAQQGQGQQQQRRHSHDSASSGNGFSWLSFGSQQSSGPQQPPPQQQQQQEQQSTKGEQHQQQQQQQQQPQQSQQQQASPSQQHTSPSSFAAFQFQTNIPLDLSMSLEQAGLTNLSCTASLTPTPPHTPSLNSGPCSSKPIAPTSATTTSTPAAAAPAAVAAAAAGTSTSTSNTTSTSSASKHDPVTERRRREAHAVYGERWSAKARRIQRESPQGRRKGWALRCVVVKSGDDCRQELLALQLIRTFGEIFKECGLPLWVRVYDILVTSNKTALIEVVPDALSIHTVKHRSPPGASLSDHFFDKYVRGTPECLAAQRKFTESLAAYSIICHLLQIKDRHNGNILIDDEGHIVHIDFGFLLSNSPGGVNFESAPFKLTRELLEVMDSNSEGKPSELFDYFKVLMIQGFLAVRKHHERILLLVKMMAKSGFPCFKGGDRAVKQLEKRLHLNLTEVQSVQQVLAFISDSLDAWRTRQYDYYQRLLNGIL